jgi:hypothetical protein
MQLNSSYLYPNRIEVFTSLLASLTSERYRRVYNRNLKIFRGVDNRVDIQLKNADQKSISAGGSSLVFNLITREGKNLVIKKDCTLIADDVQNNLLGRAHVTISKTELFDIEPGFYDYSLVLETRSVIDDDEYRVIGTTLLYMDSQYGALGTIEIKEGIDGEVQPSAEVRSFLLTDPLASDASVGEFYVSDIIDTNRNTQTAQSVHTFQFYCSEFTGRVQIEGSLDNSATPKEWVTVSDLDFENETLLYENVVGKYNWFRIKHSAIDNGTARFTVGQNFNLEYSVSIYDGGGAYRVGDVITIIGSSLGGANGINDLDITVTSVNYAGSITGITWSGTSIFGVRSFVLKGTGLPSVGTIDKVLYR